MSRRHYLIAIARTGGAVEPCASTIPSKGVGDSTNNAQRIDEHQIEPNPFSAPLRMHRKDYLSRGDQSRLLSNRQRLRRGRQAVPSLDLNDRQQTVLLRYQVDLPRRGSEPTCQDAPSFPFEG